MSSDNSLILFLLFDIIKFKLHFTLLFVKEKGTKIMT